MKTIPVFIALLLATSAAVAADSFSARVHRAKLVEDSPSGKAYESVLWPQVGRYMATVMRRCFPTGTKPDTATFTMVADILPDRTLADADVRPRTRMSECFVNGFAHASFPELPKSFGERGIPIEIDMRVTP